MSFSRTRRKHLLAHVAPIALEARVEGIVALAQRRAISANLLANAVLAGVQPPSGKALKRKVDRLMAFNDKLEELFKAGRLTK